MKAFGTCRGSGCPFVSPHPETEDSEPLPAVCREPSLPRLPGAVCLLSFRIFTYSFKHTQLSVSHAQIICQIEDFKKKYTVPLKGSTRTARHQGAAPLRPSHGSAQPRHPTELVRVGGRARHAPVRRGATL